MAMDEQQMRQVVEWFRSKVGEIVCSICSQTEFKFDAELTALPVWRTDPEPHADFSDGVPAVRVTCTHCAYIRLFSAVRMGLVPAPKRAPSPPRAAPLQDS